VEVVGCACRTSCLNVGGYVSSCSVWVIAAKPAEVLWSRSVCSRMAICHGASCANRRATTLQRAQLSRRNAERAAQ
jgi:hypothetical protein